MGAAAPISTHRTAGVSPREEIDFICRGDPVWSPAAESSGFFLAPFRSASAGTVQFVWLIRQLLRRAATWGRPYDQMDFFTDSHARGADFGKTPLRREAYALQQILESRVRAEVVIPRFHFEKDQKETPLIISPFQLFNSSPPISQLPIDDCFLGSIPT